MFARVYWLFSHLGMMTLSASLLMGFKYEADAPNSNLIYNVVLYGAFIAVHIVMTMPSFKQAVFGSRHGNLTERQIYVTISIVTWVAVYWLHKPIAGFSYDPPDWLRFLGYCSALLSLFAFFEFATFEGLANLVGMPGSQLSHSVGEETPLMTEGPYAAVRHPMYRAAFFLGISTLLIHPNSCQLLFVAMVGASFLGFIPFEEKQLIQARGDEYREYKQATPYRVFRGIW